MRTSSGAQTCRCSSGGPRLGQLQDRSLHRLAAMGSVCNSHCLVLVWNVCSQVDPIVASFSGGAVGVISALMVVEINNVKQQEHKRCKYCQGTGT